MKTRPEIVRAAGALLAIAVSAAVGSPPALACGEGQFNMGQGMRYQGYLAPRPATVLVYADAPAGVAGDTQRLYRGLAQAGHKLTVVSDPGELSTALASGRFAIVIADLDRVDAVAGTQAVVLPVVERKARKAPGLRERFPLVLVDGASLGQALKVIDQAIALPR